MPDDQPLAETLVSPAGPPARLLPHSAEAPQSTDRVFEEATRDLLHRRLLLCARLSTIAALVLLGVSLASGGRGAPDAVLGLFANVSFCVLGVTALVLLRGRPSVARLRTIEVVLFSSVALFCGVLRFVSNLGLPPESPDPRHAVTAVEYSTALANIAVYFLIFFYGLLVPTSRRNSLIIVGWMAAVPLLAIVASAIANPALRPHAPVLLAVTAVGVTMAGAGAVFGAVRINTLQREAFEARREAQQVGAYTLQKQLGKGGMGEVWLAEHRLLKRPCAIKFIRPDLAANPATAARFEREVRAVTALTHFNTIRIYDYGRADDGSFYYVMEYLDGPTLEDLVKRAGPLEPAHVVYLLRQLCGALAEAHAAGLVHRDLKPSNVIVASLGGQRDVAKLLDFGLVQDLSTESGERLTQAGVVMGTPAYMCPEQAAGSNAVDARGDIYSLGAVAFFMLTGRPPFVCSTVGEYITAHLTQAAPNVGKLRPDTTIDLVSLVACCLMKNPGDRYQSAAELADALAGCGWVGDWSAARAAEWWAAHPSWPGLASSESTATPHKPERAAT
jgi:eukaryotic-like serine/threonine-protein kinase